MTISIQLLTAKEEIMVGDTSFPGRATTGGGLSVAGHQVRAITLGERNQLLALTTGADRQGQVATLIRDAATGSLGGSVDRDVVDAIEAVALHLAGASMPGSLARTTLLVGRSMGDAAAGITALEADRLAEALEDALALPHRTSAGWTTISYPSSEPGPLPTDGSPAGRSVASVRDELAALLIQRDEEPLNGDLADAMLHRTDLAPNADTVGPSSAPAYQPDIADGPARGDLARRDLVSRDRAGDGAGHVAGDRADEVADDAAGDRASGGTAELPGPPIVDRWTPAHPSGAAGTTPTGSWARDVAPTFDAPGRSSRSVDPAGSVPAVATAPNHGGVGTEPSTPSGATVAPLVGATRSTATSPSVVPADRSSPGGPGPRPAGRPRAAADSRVGDAVDDSTLPAAVFDLESAALALHRAADLRGASR